eukprot:CAMPEP_0172508320 /NCGR_PEP_ID=MMETSP1066-20121228/211029_1 /TAXON_ID=671091 /ORGANISM="Coscinodiscus wailesii, Strain CCMP2513" /LENGTH=240 /DNA_ID=CAMNT_0013286249 /DNA_START=71 /DNA_END=790 /DNA_ORIENTATION=-
MSSFGQWYEEQKHQHDANANNDTGISLSSVSGLFTSSGSNNDAEGGEDGGGEGNSLLPLFGGGDAGNAAGGGISGMKQALEKQLPSQVCGMNYAQRFRMFCALQLISALFFFLGFTVGLTTIYIRPQKFALCFTFGSLTFMASFAILKGPIDHFIGLLDAERLPFTVIYLGSMFATLYCTFTVGGISGYTTVIVSSGCQIVALLWYLVTFIPGGKAGMNVLMKGVMTIIGPIITGCVKVW